MAEQLIERISALVDEARANATSQESAERIDDIRDRLDGPLRLAIAGKVKAGKSTLLNALLGERLAPTDAGECTRIVTWYRESHRPQVTMYPLAGEPQERPYRRDGGALEIDLGEATPETIDHLEVGWPTSRLRHLTIIDTPGIASIAAEVSARTHRVLAADDGRVPVADAVLYLLRHTHASDMRFLESFHDDELVHGTPINAVGVLSRADEIGSCRLDAMQVANRVADRYAADARLHRLCPVVVPVDGLLAEGAGASSEPDYDVLASIAATSAEDVAATLLTADRFVAEWPAIEAPSERRAELLERFGMYGVRLAVELIRSGKVSTASALSAELAEVSGLRRLESVVSQQFEDRTRLLKARSAVAALERALREGSFDDAQRLLGALEEITAGAHELVEVRLLFDLRAGTVSLPEERAVPLDRLLGGSGHDATSRLGLSPDATAADINAAAFAALADWHAVAEHPLSRRAVQIAARTAIRTIEGLVAANSDAEESVR
jgi:hypothetical protein